MSDAQKRLAAECRVEVIYTQTGTTNRPGGQHAGNPATEIRVTHLPTGLVAQCGWHRSMHRNRRAAISMIEWGLEDVAGD
jgi:protein subunit release factor A